MSRESGPGLAGRSVVASAPALGAGDRRFESCRPDDDTTCAAPAVHLRRHQSEERRRDPEPDPGQADRRGALRGAQAEPRRGLPADRQADQRARLPPRQGPAGRHRPAGRPRARSSTRRSTTPCRQKYREAMEENSLEPVAQPADRGDQARGQRGLRVHRRGRRQARVHAAVVRRRRGPGRRRWTSPTPTSRSSSTRCASGSAPSATSSGPPPTATSWSSTSRPPRTARSSRAPS